MNPVLTVLTTNLPIIALPFAWWFLLFILQFFSVRVKKKANKKPKKTSTGKRPSNKKTIKYKVTAKSGLHLRKGPNSTILGLMPYGKTVTSDGKKKGNWYHVKYGSKWGYAYNTWLKKM